MNRYVKVKGYPNWFLVFDADTKVDPNFDMMKRAEMQGIVMYNYLYGTVHDGDPENFQRRMEFLDTNAINYKAKFEKFGTLIIRPIGSYMLLKGNEVVDERFDTHFPIDDTADIVICENDMVSEKKWNEYLIKRFPEKSISTINFFRMRSDEEIKKYFEKAKYITFSTTFSDLDWYEKLVRNLTPNHKVIGFSHTSWDNAFEVYSNVEVVETI